MGFLVVFDKPTWLLVIVVLLSLGVGSFLGVVIYRLPLMLSSDNNRITLWQPYSFCTCCKRRLPYKYLIPLFSYCYLQGRSHCCDTRLSHYYFLLEALSLGSSMMLVYHFGFTWQLVFGLILTWALLALFFIDLNTLLLPDRITLPLLCLGLVINYFNIFTTLQSAILGMILAYGFFSFTGWLMLRIRKNEVLGRGDYKLIAALGAWFGWQMLPALVLIASLTGSVIGLIYIVLKGKSFSVRLPFGPFLAFAGWLVLFFGPILSSQQRLGELLW